MEAPGPGIAFVCCSGKCDLSLCKLGAGAGALPTGQQPLWNSDTDPNCTEDRQSVKCGAKEKVEDILEMPKYASVLGKTGLFLF